MNEQNLFYKKLKLICAAKHRKLADLEKLIGVTPGYLSRGKVSIEKAYVIAQELNMSMDDILTYTPVIPQVCAFCGEPIAENDYYLISKAFNYGVVCPHCRITYTIKISV